MQEVSFESCFQIMCGRDSEDGTRIVKHPEGLFTQIPLPVAFSSVQLLSCARLFVTPWTAACQASLSITNSQSLPKLIS